MIDTLVLEKKDSLFAIALLENGDLREVEFSNTEGVSEESVYLGRVTHKLDLAHGKIGFLVNIGDTQDAFLNCDEQGFDDDKITEGQSIVVQVSQEKREEKGAKVIRNIKFAGKNIVYCPYMMGVQVSSKIRQHPSLEDYRQLVTDNITGQEGWILRTSSVEVSNGEILEEMKELRDLYEDIRRKARTLKAPSLLYTKGNPLVKYINMYKDTLNKVVVNSHNVEKEINEGFEGINVEYLTEPFDEYGLDEAINDALNKEIKMKNGGRITIEETKAFVAIDVDSAGSGSNGPISKLNADAAKEIVRHIRLRNLSGKIVIDFAGSGDYKYMKPVLDVLEEELKGDPNKSYLAGLSRAGNVEIVRARHRPSLRELMTEECRTCQGTGRVSR